MKPKLLSFNFRQFLLTIVLGILAVGSAWAGPSYRVLHNFNGTDGSALWGGVTVDQNYRVYGTTAGGGTGNCPYGCGTVFELSQANGSWVETTVHDFQGGDGDGTYSSLVMDPTGNLYGVTMAGGKHNRGTAFELLPANAEGQPDSVSQEWTEGTLYDFCPKQDENGCTDGAGIMLGLVRSSNGKLYGTKSGGGPNGGGVVFKLAPGRNGWKETVIHGFYPSYYNQPAPDGTAPYAGLISDSAGNLYGTTWTGGVACAGGNSCGVVYELTPQIGGGWKEIVLHRFRGNGTDGENPGWGALYMDADGSLYGTTTGGGCCIGVIYKLTPQPDGHWKKKILYQFKGGAKGYGPNAGVVMDKAGNLYGITDAGGYGDCGVIYKLAPQPTGKWAYTVLHTFGQGDDGCLPEGNLAIDQNGNLYGGTVLGGAYGAGIVFKLTP